MSNLNMENFNSRWIDDDTFVIDFDGGIDEDGDEFFYHCEYLKNEGEWYFHKMYEDDYVEATFDTPTTDYIKKCMKALMIQGEIANMKTWKIPVTWEMSGLVIVQAPSLEAAMKYVQDDEYDIPLPEDADYVDDSWRLSYDMSEIDDVRSYFNDNQPD